jgi:hypothetical protein
MIRDRSRRARVLIGVGLFLIWPVLFLGCDSKCTEIETCVEVASFQEMAREASCAQLRNELFMIDRHLVFWDVEGTCPDASWSRTLYGHTPDEVLCRDWCTISGGMRVYADSSYQSMFETILSNRYERDLGLGRHHIVLPIEF